MKKSFLSVLLLLASIVSVLSSCAVVRIPPVEMGIENVFIVSNARKYRAEETIPPNGIDTLTASLAKNEAEGMQFILNFEEDVKNVSVSMTVPKSAEGYTIDDVRLFREHYYYIEKQAAEYPVEGWYPDALIPLEYDDLNSVDIPAEKNQGFWITVTAPKGQPSGIYTATVTVTHDSGVINIPVEIEVWDFELPEEIPFEGYYCIWMWSLWNTLSATGSDEGEDYYETFEQYFDFFLEYRMNPGHVYSAETTPEALAEVYKEYLENPRVQNLKYYTTFIKNSDGTYSLGEDSIIFFTKMREYGLLDKIVTDVIRDEPPDIESINKEGLAKKAALEKLFPEVRTQATTAPRESLYGAIDAWCGIWSSQTTEDEVYVTDRITAGDDVHWYGCVSPRYPYPSYHIQDYLMTSRLVMWMQKDWQISGNLYWTATLGSSKYNAELEVYETREQWTDPYAFPVSAGDGYLVYIGGKNDGIINRNIPVPSMRMESIRDGTEDNIYLTLLEEKITERLETWGIEELSADEIMDTYYTPLYNSMGDFDHDETLMLRMREIIAHDIMSESNLIAAVLPYMDEESTNKREVRVYAEPGASVLIDGEAPQKVVEKENYSIYSSVFLTAYENLREISVSVNGESFTRYLKRIEDAEYIELENMRFRENADILDIPIDRIAAREENAANMFTDHTIQNIGSLEDQITSTLVTDAVKKIISDDIEMSFKVRECIRADINNTIPLVVTGEDFYAGFDETDIYKKRLTLYVPHGAEVRVEGVSALLKDETEKYDEYEYDIYLSEVGRNFYEVEVSFGDKTELFKKMITQNISSSCTMTDLSDPDIIDAIASVPGNRYGENVVVSDEALNIRFDADLRRFMLTEQAFSCGRFSLTEYNTLRFVVKNTGTEVSGGVSVALTAGSSEIILESSGKFEAGESRVVTMTVPKNFSEDDTLQKVSALKLFSSSGDDASFAISDIVLIRFEDVK